MKDSVRRFVIFFVIIAAGLILVLFDLPAVFLVLIVIAFTALILLLSGSVKLPKLRLPKLFGLSKKVVNQDGKEQTPPSHQKSLKEKAGKKPESKTKNATKKSPGKGAFGTPSIIRDAFSSMRKAFSILSADIGKTRKPATAKIRDKKKIDRMLDQSVQGRAPDIKSFNETNHEITPSGKQSVPDPFSSLVKKQIDTELLDSAGSDLDMGDLSALNDLDLSADMSGAFGEDISNLDIAIDMDDGITLDDDSDSDEVASILAAHEDNQDTEGEGGPGGNSDEMDLGGFGDLDIDSIDLDQELGSPDITEKSEPRVAPKPVKTSDVSDKKSISSPSAPMSEVPFSSAPAGKMTVMEPSKGMGDSMMSFSTGKGMDDDLMASLKSDSSNVKRDNNAPLLRDLKDVKVPAVDLEKELEGILSMTKVKK